MKLYELTEQYKGLLELMENENLSNEYFADTLEGMDHEFDEKVENCMKLYSTIVGYMGMIEVEVERLNQLHDKYANRSKWLKSYVKFHMEHSGRKKVQTPLFSLSIRKGVLKLGEIIERKVPKKFFKVVPETMKLDKRELLKARKEGEIEGVELIEGESSLIIR